MSFSGASGSPRKMRKEMRKERHGKMTPKATRRRKARPISRASALGAEAIAQPPQGSCQATRKPSRKAPGKLPHRKTANRAPKRAPKAVQRLARWVFGGRPQSPRKVLVAGGSVATLAVLAIVPARVGSQAIALSSCQEVITSGAEISRGQITSLLAIPEGSTREAVRQVVDSPYCLLPDGGAKASQSDTDKSETSPVAGVIEREAYPLAFDPEAWVVVSYSAGEYVGYDFVFKP